MVNGKGSRQDHHAQEVTLNKLRWVNKDLNKRVFDAIQRGHRLAEKLGYANLEEAEAAYATQAQAPDGAESQLSQLPTDELASHVLSLQHELSGHIAISKASLTAFDDVMAELGTLKEDNERLRRELEEKEAGRDRCTSATSSVTAVSQDDGEECAHLRSELAALRKQYEELKIAKEKGAAFHQNDYRRWKEFKEWLESDDRNAEALGSKRKRRKMDGPDNAVDPRNDRMEIIRAKFHSIGPRTEIPDTTTTVASPSKQDKKTSVPVLMDRSLNQPTAPVESTGSPSIRGVKRKHEEDIPDVLPDSSETEPDSQPPVLFRMGATPLSTHVRLPFTGANDSSDTEPDSQPPQLVFPTKATMTPRPTDVTPKPRPQARRSAQHLWTPVSPARAAAERTKGGRPMDPFRAPATMKMPAATPAPRSKTKVKQEQDENTPVSVAGSSKKQSADYYAQYKGRGRYADQAQAGQTTINAMYTIDPEHNSGVGFQFEEVVRDKEKRRHMHADDCECCRGYYETIKPLPARLQPPLWRSPQSSPSKPERVQDHLGPMDDSDLAQTRRNEISRHRHQWKRGSTPPDYWNIGFPDTQEVDSINQRAKEMHERKVAGVEAEASRGGRFKRRR